MLERLYYVYMMANYKRGTLYTGVTNSIATRSTLHREDRGAVFTAKHKLHRLVWYEPYQDVREAIAHEKRLKRWNRQWKIELIEKANPDWRDLWFELNR